MKYWCYYTDVVRYLERIEAGQSQKREGPAYLVWQDGDGPSMIIGPGVEWYRGDGPPPDIDAITLRVGRLPAPPPRRTKLPPVKKANKRSTNFPKPAQNCSPRRQSVKFPKSAQTYSQHRKKQQSRRRQPAVKTPNHLPSIKNDSNSQSNQNTTQSPQVRNRIPPPPPPPGPTLSRHPAQPAAKREFSRTRSNLLTSSTPPPRASSKAAFPEAAPRPSGRRKRSSIPWRQREHPPDPRQERGHPPSCGRRGSAGRRRSKILHSRLEGS